MSFFFPTYLTSPTLNTHIHTHTHTIHQWPPLAWKPSGEGRVVKNLTISVCLHYYWPDLSQVYFSVSYTTVSHPSFVKGHFWGKYNTHIEKNPNLNYTAWSISTKFTHPYQGWPHSLDHEAGPSQGPRNLPNAPSPPLTTRPKSGLPSTLISFVYF